jgi:hypothetical protein
LEESRKKSWFENNYRTIFKHNIYNNINKQVVMEKQEAKAYIANLKEQLANLKARHANTNAQHKLELENWKRHLALQTGNAKQNVRITIESKKQTMAGAKQSQLREVENLKNKIESVKRYL